MTRRDLVAVLAGDGHGSRSVREHGCGERTFSPPTCRPRGLSSDDPPLRLAGKQFDYLRIQARSFGIDRCLMEQSGSNGRVSVIGIPRGTELLRHVNMLGWSARWIASIGLDPSLFGIHSLRRTKAIL
jgi:hypothetical protein